MQLFSNLYKQFNFRMMLIFFILIISINLQAQGSGKTLSFDGVDDYINIGNISTNGISELSIEAWVNHFDAGDDRIVCKSTGTEVADHTFSIGLASNKVRVRINGIGDYNGTKTLLTNRWYHVAFTYDGDSIKIYVDGILDNDYDAILGSINNSTQPVMIGNVNSIDNRYFYGNIDEVRIWNKAITESEIRTNMCKGVNALDANLVGYWRLNSDAGNSAIDETGNSNGTLVNMTNDDWIWSGAPVGDLSMFDYTAVPSIPSLYSATLISSEGDTFTAAGESGTFTGIHVYMTKSAAQRSGAAIPAGWSADPQRYWGVYAIGSSPIYSINYNYNGHSGIINEGDLALCVRDNNSDDSWLDLSAVLNETNNTLTKTSQSNSEYALGSKTGLNSLPVELTSFSGDIVSGSVKLFWETATEINNCCFNVERKLSIDNSEVGIWEIAGNVDGFGNSNSPKNYFFIDNPSHSGKYQYRLKQIDNDGSYRYSTIVEIEIDANIPAAFNLFQNYPNPFNPTTVINFSIPKTEFVTLKIYDLLGNEISTLVNGIKTSGNHRIEFDGSNLSSGIYFYELAAGQFRQINKMLLLK